jgi:hypothetical protein
MSLSKEAMDNKPKKPLVPYYVFKNEKMAAYKDDDKKAEKIKAEWNAIDPKKKENIQEQYKAELEQYKVDFEKWNKKYDVKKDNGKKDKIQPKEEEKTEKSKGTKVEKKEKKEPEKEAKVEKKETKEPEKGASKKAVSKSLERKPETKNKSKNK